MRAVVLLVVLAALAPGCARPAGPSDASSGALRAGDVAVYELDSLGTTFNATFAVGAPRERAFPMERLAWTVPVTVSVTSNGIASGKPRVVDLSLTTGEILAVGDLAPGAPGSEQYLARSGAWVGEPAGAPRADRCLVGVFLQAIVGATRPRDPIPMGAFSDWDADGDAKLRKRATGKEFGELRLASPDPWPERAAWSYNGTVSCTLRQLSFTPGEEEIPWGTRVPLAPPAFEREAFSGRLPNVTGPVISITLRQADEAVSRDARAATFFSTHPDAWLVQAEFHGPAALGIADDEWVLLYGSPADHALAWFRVTRWSGGLTVGEIPDPTARRVPPISSLSRGIVPLGAVADRLGWDEVPPRAVDAIGWNVAPFADSELTDDAAVWRLRWATPEGLRGVEVAAVSGAPLTYTILPVPPQ